MLPLIQEITGRGLTRIYGISGLGLRGSHGFTGRECPLIILASAIAVFSRPRARDSEVLGVLSE